MRIEKEINELEKEFWSFTLIGSTLYLNEYRLLIRESTRHRKYRSIKVYDRLMKRNSTIEEHEVPFTNQLKQDALEAYFKTIECALWSERNK
jgi:hypothetical protein